MGFSLLLPRLFIPTVLPFFICCFPREGAGTTDVNGVYKKSTPNAEYTWVDGEKDYYLLSEASTTEDCSCILNRDIFLAEQILAIR